VIAHYKLKHGSDTFPPQKGVYSGVQASGNGDSSDASNLDATFLRGIQPSNDEGVVQFESIFPGHYTGRATHIHGMYTEKHLAWEKAASASFFTTN
jgi:protocatechuate 3,4-dioxygenase beta subunit